ncbi:MAG: hypothetical protein ACYS0G_02195 [Planctomycetota bacterium]|jgi:O-antigen/teichoic acid export membrane protein
MASEAKRGLIRIAANYTRVVAAVFLGLLLVPLLLQATGDNGWALVTLFGSTIGLAAMAQEVIASSLIRELGAAYHSGDPDRFRSVYNAAIAISTVIALLAALVFAVLWLLVPLFHIPAGLHSAARWLVFTRGAETCAILLLSAPFNMYKVSERMVAYNAWLIVHRMCYVVGATFVILGTADHSHALVLYAVISSTLVIVARLVAVSAMLFIESGLIPAPGATNRDTVRMVLRIGGWNAGAVVATMSYTRVGPVLMNLAFGLAGNLILGMTIQVTDSVRRLTVGMTDGLEAVSARLSATGSDGAVRTLMRHATRLHGFAAFPVAVLVLVLADPLLRLWLGGWLQDPGTTVPMAVTLVRIMMLGMIARAISDGWIRIFYGAGHVHRYAPLLIASGVAYPLLMGLLLLALPESVGYTAVCWAFSALLVGVHAILAPLAGARALGTTYGPLLSWLARPLIIAVACSPILILAAWKTEQWTWPRLLVVVGVYGMVYVGLCLIFVMDRSERKRFAKAALRRLPHRRMKA